MDTAFDRGPARTPVPPAPGAMRSSRVGDTRETSLLEPLERVFTSLKRMAGNYATLALVDLRRASVQFAWLVGAGIVVAVLVVTAWLAGVVGLGVLLLGSGVSWPAVLGIAALLNLVGAGIVLWAVKNIFDEAPFAATLKQIKTAGADADAPPAV
ncbi:MAG: hypothetical protein ACXWUB_03775 [Burkholderiales bacterium]